MREPKLSDADAARLRVETYAPLVESDLLAIKAHVDAGTLPDDRLHALLGWIEGGEWSGRVESEDLVALYKSSCRPNPAQKHGCKALAAAAIHRQHAGRYVARGYAWVSDDGTNLRTELR